MKNKHPRYIHVVKKNEYFKVIWENFSIYKDTELLQKKPLMKLNFLKTFKSFSENVGQTWTLGLEYISERTIHTTAATQFTTV